MNGVSFSEFESSSFDALYSNGFANAKHMDEVGKELMKLKPGEIHRSEIAGPRPVPKIAQLAPMEDMRVLQPERAEARSQAKMHKSQNLSSHALPAAHPQRVPLNDMGVMPGSRRVDPSGHAWRPSQEAHERAQNAPAAAALEAARVAPTSKQGAFVGWKSN
ncbi:unnamed protein product [Symbiodinium natans]|uniref:Uncharacterized protein n=1 Tax=Symbiodinium natans TaxID=878477 RepID=A0A812H5T3_9DINO|nr:unnamed protein product [Symbiodinium natans]